MRGKKAYFTRKGSRCIHDFSLWHATGLFFLIFFFTPQLSFSQEEPEYEEISVFLNVPQIGVIEGTAYIKGQVLYLPVKDLFDFLKIQNTVSPGYDSVSGYFINPQSVYLINRISNRIEYQNKIFELKPGDLIRTDNNLYLRSNYFGEVFGLECNFDFRFLTVYLKTQLELPLIREMKQELMRRNIRHLKGEIKADTTIRRNYPFFHLGMADWSVLTTQQLSGKNDVILGLTLGSILAGGETNVMLNYYRGIPFTEKQQTYYWHFVNNDLSAIRQITVGKISPQATSTVNGPVLGVQLTNTPTSYRRSFSTYRLSDYTEPGWIVELYVNSVLVDYVKADAAGLFTFDIPLVYGNSSVKLRFYGPWGEERSSEQNISVPYNFLPPNKLEYTVSSGMVEDGRNSLLSRGIINYGAGQRLTIGGGIEYLSSVTSGKAMPFFKFSTRIASNIMMTGEYTYGVKGKAIFNYRLPSGLSLEVNYTNYQKNQTAIINPYLEDRKFALSLPIHRKSFTTFLKFTIDQFILPTTKYIYSEFLISGSVLGVNTNLTTTGMFSNLGRPDINSTLSLGFRLPKSFTFTPQVQYNFSANQIMSAKFGMEKSLFNHGAISLSYEYNFWGNISNLQIGMRYEFNFAQTGLTTNYSNGETTLGEFARGSLMLDTKSHFLGASNRNSVGKGGIVILPFLDLNGNGHRDADEPRVTGLNVHVTGGRIEQSRRDSTVRVFNLEPFTSYFIEIERTSFENVSWQIKNPTISVAVNANQFTMVEVPVSVFGEISGMVYLMEDSTLMGQGRIIISFFKDNSTLAGRTTTENDGYFSFLGLTPGSYTARIDEHQLSNLKMTSTPDHFYFTIKRTIQGDQVEGPEFILHSLPIDTSALLAKAAESKHPSLQEQNPVPEKEKHIDSLKEKQEGIIPEKKALSPSLQAQESLVKPVITDTLTGMKRREYQITQNVQPEILPVLPKQSDTINLPVKNNIPVTIPANPEISNPEKKHPDTTRQGEKEKSLEKLIIYDSCDFAIQTKVSYPLASALTTQKELADTYGRPVMIISEGGICKLRITGFCGRNEAGDFLLKLAGKGYPGAYILQIRGYSIQVGAFHVRAYALETQSRLVDSFSRPILIVYEEGYYKVRITGFIRYHDAKKFLPEVNNQGFQDTYLLKSH